MRARRLTGGQGAAKLSHALNGRIGARAGRPLESGLEEGDARWHEAVHCCRSIAEEKAIRYCGARWRVRDC